MSLTHKECSVLLFVILKQGTQDIKINEFKIYQSEGIQGTNIVKQTSLT